MTLPLRLTLTLIVAVLAWLFDGAGGVLTLALFAVGVVPGLSLGFALFGRKQAAGWVAGAAIGYALLALAFWIPFVTGDPRPAAFVFAWVILLLVVGAVAKAVSDDLGSPLITLPEWTKRDSTALLLVLHLVPLIASALVLGPPERTGVAWHGSQNPYFLPAAVFATRGHFGGGASPQSAIAITGMMTSLLLVASIYVAAWGATGRRWAAIAAAGISVLSPGFQGLFALRHQVMRVEPIGLLTGNLPQTMWWAPQHGMACVLGVLALIAASRWQGSRWAVYPVTGLVLGLAVTFNPLLGAIFCGVFALTALVDALTGRMTFRQLVAAASAAVPVGLALWWWVQTGTSASSETISFGLHPDAGSTPLKALFLSLGGVLIPGLLGLLPSRHVPFRPVLPAVFALILGLLAMHFVRITDPSWVGLRAGNIILVAIGMLIARGLVLTYHRSGRVLAIAFAVVLLLTGLPTTVIDWIALALAR